VTTADTPCASGAAEADDVALTTTCGATTTDACGGSEPDETSAREALATKLRVCFTTSVSDVFAIVPSVQVDASGCLTSFKWLAGDAGLSSSKTCVAQALAATPRWSCLAASACGSARTVVALGR
jgi:hypothetical protein